MTKGIRISVAARCRVVVNDRYALIISLNGLKRGERSLAPIGGGVKTTEAGKQHLIDEFGVDPESFEKGYDLRFRLPEERLNDFRMWLETTHDLEADTAAREFIDEVVDERRLLPSGLARQVTFTRTALHDGQMPLWSYLGGKLELVDTHAFEWIYAASLPSAAEKGLVQATLQPEPLIELVTADEINEGHSSLSNISNWTTLLLS